MASDDEIFESPMDIIETVVPDLIQPVANNMVQSPAEDEPVADAYVKPRGSFAESVAEQTEVTQELLDPAEVLNLPQSQPGIKRI